MWKRKTSVSHPEITCCDLNFLFHLEHTSQGEQNEYQRSGRMWRLGTGEHTPGMTSSSNILLSSYLFSFVSYYTLLTSHKCTRLCWDIADQSWVNSCLHLSNYKHLTDQSSRPHGRVLAQNSLSARCITTWRSDFRSIKHVTFWYWYRLLQE